MMIVATTLKTKTSIRKLFLLSLLARPSVSLVTGNVGKRGILSTSSSTINIRPTSFGVLASASRRNSVAANSRRFMSSSSSSSSSSTGSGPPAVDISHIGKSQMEEILDDYENGGRDESQYVVIDVRTEQEIYTTGKLSPSVHTLPVQVILQANVFQMDPDEFEDLCGFEKPTPDETLVFSCAAGVRSVYACQAAARAGYTKLVNYMGGSNEWFAPY